MVKRIHTFGDSHCYFGFSKIKIVDVEIYCNHLGPKLMYSVGRDGLLLLNISDVSKYKSIPKQCKVLPGDTIIFCFGEIDCRCHIDKYKNNYKSVIDDIVKKYIEVIELNSKLIPDLKICIFNVLPSVQKHNTAENKEYPYLGTDEERQIYVKYMNSKLEEWCNIKKFIFMDVHDAYCDEGFLNKKLSDGNVHINDPIHLTNFIKNNLLK